MSDRYDMTVHESQQANKIKPISAKRARGSSGVSRYQR